MYKQHGISLVVLRNLFLCEIWMFEKWIVAKLYHDVALKAHNLPIAISVRFHIKDLRRCKNSQCPILTS